MRKVTVWFNRGLSQTVHLIKGFDNPREQGEEMQIVCTHISADAAVAEVADKFETEPTGSAADLR